MYKYPSNETATTTDSFHAVQPLDITYGSVFILAGILGLIGNFLSFLFFRSKNRDLSSILYQLITLNDFLICAALFPNIDAAFAPQRAGLLAQHAAFCEAWVMVTWVLPQMSIFLVGLLSVSRLFILRCPNRELNSKLAYLLPAICILIILDWTPNV